MSKELEALKTIKNFLGYNYCSVDLPSELKCVEQALQRLEQIDNANPSEALELLDHILYCNNLEWMPKAIREGVRRDLGIVQQALLKAQEQEKVLSIIKEYQVDIWLLKQCDYENYIRIRKEARVSVGQIINENGVIFEDEIPQEEFDLLKDVVSA